MRGVSLEQNTSGRLLVRHVVSAIGDVIVAEKIAGFLIHGIGGMTLIYRAPRTFGYRVSPITVVFLALAVAVGTDVIQGVAYAGELVGPHRDADYVLRLKDGLLLATNSAFDTKDLAIDLMTGPTARENRDAGKDYATLTEDYKEYAWFCFLPTSYVPLLTYPTVTLKVKYDVFDRHDNEVRLNQTAQNELSLNYFIRDDNANITPKPADHFKIKVKIKPSYLHQLIDDDAEITLDITNQD